MIACPLWVTQILCILFLQINLIITGFCPHLIRKVTLFSNLCGKQCLHLFHMQRRDILTAACQFSKQPLQEISLQHTGKICKPTAPDPDFLWMLCLRHILDQMCPCFPGCRIQIGTYFFHIACRPHHMRNCCRIDLTKLRQHLTANPVSAQVFIQICAVCPVILVKILQQFFNFFSGQT